MQVMLSLLGAKVFKIGMIHCVKGAALVAFWDDSSEFGGNELAETVLLLIN